MKIKRIPAFFMVIVLIITMLPVHIASARSAIGTLADGYYISGDWTYTVLTDGTASVECCVVNEDYERVYDSAYSGTENDLVIPDSIDGYTVSTVGVNALAYDRTIRSVTVPDSVKRIEDRAFYNMILLESINLPEGIEYVGESILDGTDYFANGDNWTGDVLYIDNYLIATGSLSGVYDIPDETILIAKAAFKGKSITGIKIADSVKRIEEETFAECRSLETVDFPTGIEYVGADAFYNDSSIKTVNITTLTDWLAIDFGGFSEDSDYVRYGANPLYYSRKLSINGEEIEALSIPDGTTEIKDFAFINLHTDTVEFPDGLVSIGAAAFYNCDCLESIIIPSSVRSIGYEAFFNCSRLNEITIADGVRHIGFRAFIRTGLYNNWEKLNEENFYIDNYLIYSCTNEAKELEVCEGTYLIAERALAYTLYTAITLPSELGYIDTRAFENTKGLNELYIGENVLSIGKDAFKDTNKDLVIYGESGIYPEEWAHENGIYYFARSETVPVKPEIVSAKNVNSGTEIKFSTDDNTHYYRIYGKVKNGNWQLLATVNHIYGSLNMTYINTKLKSGDICAYAIEAVNNAGTSGRDSTGEEYMYLSVPRVTLKNVSNGISLSWPSVNGTTSYIVYRKNTEGKWKILSTVKTCSYSDKKVNSGNQYVYTVRACNGICKSAYTESSLYCLKETKTTVKNSASGISVSWNSVGGTDGYYLYRKDPSSGSYVLLKTLTGTSYTDKTAKAGVKYTYAARAYRGKERSAYTAASIIRLTAPAVTLTNTKSGPKVTWGKVTGAKGYSIYRKISTGSYTKIATTTSLSYVDKAAKKNVRYYYAVRAYNGSYMSAYTGKAITVKK